MEKAGTTGQGIRQVIEFDDSLALSEGQYRDGDRLKDRIVLHFTAGTTAEGSREWWEMTPERVATAFIVGPSGMVYRMFNYVFCWAHHIGRVPTAIEESSVGIEIVNVGPLVLRGGTLHWWPPDNKFQTPYCKLTEKKKYVEAPYRGFRYWAAFPKPQVDAVVSLVNHICGNPVEGRVNVPKILSPPEDRNAFNPAQFIGFQGVSTHANYRSDKTDIGPAWPWERMFT